MPGLLLFFAEVFIPQYIPPLAGTLLVAPVGEESLKLLLTFGLEKSWYRVLQRVNGIMEFAQRKLAFPVIVGASFGLFEHFYTYGNERPELLILRIVTHVLYVSLSWLMCHDLWRRGVGFTAGLWTGLAFGAFVHCVWNYISLVRRAFGAGLLVRYL